MYRKFYKDVIYGYLYKLSTYNKSHPFKYLIIYTAIFAFISIATNILFFGKVCGNILYFIILMTYTALMWNKNSPIRRSINRSNKTIFISRIIYDSFLFTKGDAEEIKLKRKLRKMSIKQLKKLSANITKKLESINIDTTISMNDFDDIKSHSELEIKKSISEFRNERLKKLI